MACGAICLWCSKTFLKGFVQHSSTFLSKSVIRGREISIFFWRRRHHFFGGGGARRNRFYWSINAWIHTSSAFHLHHLHLHFFFNLSKPEVYLEIVYIDALNKTYSFPQSLANGHITLNTPVLVRSLKLSSVEPSQYLDGWPPGNTGCCWQSFFMIFSYICNFFWRRSWNINAIRVPNFPFNLRKTRPFVIFNYASEKKYVYVVLTLLYTARLQKIYVYPNLCHLRFHRLQENMCTLMYAS